MDGAALRGHRKWLVIALALVAAFSASLAGCSVAGATAAPPTPARPPVRSEHKAKADPKPTPDPACVTSAAKGSCGPYKDSSAAIAGGNFTVGQDVWNPIRGWSQTLHATSPGNWYVNVNLPAANTAVVSYPNVGETFPAHLPLSSFSAIYSSFSEDMHATLDTKAWSAYDVWLNDFQNEILIQNDYADHGGCNVLATATFGGTGGVPRQQWNLCRWGGSEIIWWLAGNTEQSGGVDILAMVNWLIDRGYLPAQSDLAALSYGWEICSTGGVPETFTISRFTVTASRHSASPTSG